MYRHIVFPIHAFGGFGLSAVHLHNTTEKNMVSDCGLSLDRLFLAVVGKGKNVPAETFELKRYKFNPDYDYCRKCFPPTNK